MSLFGGATPQQRTRNLVEFKAGKMHLRGNMVYPDKRKGLLYVHQGSDLLMHLCWKDRSSNAPAEDDMVIFPEEVEFKKVKQNTTGRVYILKWASNNRKIFFWMQEPKDDKDEEYCKKINDFLNHPPPPNFTDDVGSTHPLHPFMEHMASGVGGLDANDLSNVLRSLNTSEFASLFSSFGGAGAPGLMQGIHRREASNTSSTPQAASSSSERNTQRAHLSRPNTAPPSTHVPGTTATSTSRTSGTSSRIRNGGTSSTSSNAAHRSTANSTARGTAIQMSALTNVLANLGGSTQANTDAAASSSKPSIDLFDAVTSESLIPLLINKDVRDKIRAQLPEGTNLPNTESELKDSIQSPQFRQTVNALSTVIQSGELGPILTQLDYPEDIIQAANQGDLDAFARALQNHLKKSNETDSSDETMDSN